MIGLLVLFWNAIRLPEAFGKGTVFLASGGAEEEIGKIPSPAPPE